MKPLFFLVFFANIAFFLWEITNGTREFDAPERYEKNPTLQNILLVNETQLNPFPDSRVAEPTVEELSVTKKTQLPAETIEIEKQPLDEEYAADYLAKNRSFCYEIGPFMDDKIRQEWLDDAQAASESIEILNKPMDVHHGFVIFLPPRETFEKSKAYYDMLKRQGITDLWLFKKGSSRGMISLGIYRNRQSGEKIQRQYSAQGMDARIKPYLKTEQRYVVRFRNQEEIIQDLELLLGTWRRVLPALEIKEISFCEEAEDASPSLSGVAEANAV